MSEVAAHLIEAPNSLVALQDMRASTDGKFLDLLLANGREGYLAGRYSFADKTTTWTKVLEINQVRGTPTFPRTGRG